MPTMAIGVGTVFSEVFLTTTRASVSAPSRTVWSLRETDKSSWHSSESAGFSLERSTVTV
jgi:hypothetical protein